MTTDRVHEADIYGVHPLYKYGGRGQEVRDGWVTTRRGEPLDWFPSKAAAQKAVKELQEAARKAAE